MILFLEEIWSKSVPELNVTQPNERITAWVQVDHRSDSIQSSDCVANFSFFDFSFLMTIFGNLKCAIGAEFIFLSNCRFRYQLCSIKITNIKENKMQCSKSKFAVGQKNEFSTDFKFPNIVMREEKSKKEKWQRSQNLELNPTCVDVMFATACHKCYTFMRYLR